jgi:hypothetical protein
MTATKLTLRIDDELIDRAKEHSRRTGRSVSRLVGDYFRSMTGEELSEPTKSPIVDSLHGLLRGSDLDEEDYRRHLERKHR